MNDPDATPDTGKTYNSQDQFARAAGVSQPTLSRDLKRDGCPIRPTAPWDGDDLATFTEWRAAAAPEGSIDDMLKRAQAIKAQVLACRYTLEMASTIGGAGRELIDAVYAACDTATMLAYREVEHWMAQGIASRGQVDYDVGKAMAWSLAREYGDAFARHLHGSFQFRGKHRDEMRPIIEQMRRAVADMEALGKLNVETLDEITRAIDAGEQAASAKFDKPIAPTVTERLASGGGEASRVGHGVRKFDARLALDIEAATRIRNGEPRDEVLADVRTRAEALKAQRLENAERAKHERARDMAETQRLIEHYRALADRITAGISDEEVERLAAGDGEAPA